jgi:hypothetical protein
MRPSFTITNNHEPVGFTVIEDCDASTRPCPNMNIYQGGGNQALVTDQTTAPLSANTALRTRSVSGTSQGGGPEHQEVSFAASNYAELYIHMAVRADSGYATPGGSKVQKLLHIWGYTNSGATSQVVPSLLGVSANSTSSNMTAQIRTQNMHPSDPNGGGGTAYNVGTGGPRNYRAIWADIEIYLKMNTGSNTDGIIQMWVNDTLRVNVTDAVFNTTGNKKWNKVQLNPTYGGTGTVTVDSDLFFDHLYISGN